MTSPNQGLSSTTPSCGKTKDPGNEVEKMTEYFLFFYSVFIISGKEKKNKNSYLGKVDDTFTFSSLILKDNKDMHTMNPAVSKTEIN